MISVANLLFCTLGGYAIGVVMGFIARGMGEND